MNKKSIGKNIENKASRHQVNELQERVKELNCLYGLTDIVKDITLSMDEAIKKIVELIPTAWHYPDITCSRITVDNQDYKSNNFKETKWSQISNIILDDKKIGVLEVYYLEEKPQLDEGPFLFEERRLIDAISDLVGKYIEKSIIKKELKESKTEGKKQDWEVIIDLLIKTDPRTLLRMTRKMTYYLYRFENEKITSLLTKVCPIDKDSSSEWCGINMPNPRQDLDSLKTVQKNIFEIAKETIPPKEISNMFQNWMKQDKARPLIISSQKEGISLIEITDELDFPEIKILENLTFPIS